MQPFLYFGHVKVSNEEGKSKAAVKLTSPFIDREHSLAKSGRV